MDRRAFIAVDLGAESCRVSLLRWSHGQPEVKLVHRFANGPVRHSDGSLRWPLEEIAGGIETGIKKSAELAPEGVASVAIDGWAVDYVRLGGDGHAQEAPYCYRDERNAAAAAELHKQISPERMRELTGVEQQPLNTIYQLYADKLAGKAQAQWLNLPEYFLHHLGADPVAEYTNATHTQLVDLRTGVWSREIFDAAGLDASCAPRIVPPGTPLGKLTGPLATLSGLDDTELIAPACHDTASAIVGIAETGDDWAYISSGTWSLVGSLVDSPLNSAAVCEDNFTNLGGVGGKICFHKSINGMWILKQCMEQWKQCGADWDLTELLQAAERERAPKNLIDTTDPLFIGMGEMPARINQHFAANGMPLVSERGEDAPQMVSMLMHSLAASYARVIERVRVNTGKDLRRIVIVGGGAKNEFLRRLTEERTGLKVTAGPFESSTVGNLAVQCTALQGVSSASPIEFGQRTNAWAGLIGEAMQTSFLAS